MNVASAYTLSGSSVYIDDSKVYIEANPHTMTESGYVYVNLISKQFTGNIDFAIGVDSGNAKMTSFEIWQNMTLINQTIPVYTTVYYNETTNTSTTLKNYSYVSGYDYTYMTGEGWKRYDLASISHSYDGKNIWYVGKSVNVNAGKIYNARVYLEINPNTNGKYDIAIKPSSETIAQSIANNHFYLLDPWFNSSYIYRYPINCSLGIIGAPVQVNGSDGVTINGNKQVLWTLCTSGNLSLYFNSATDYVVANDTGLVPFDIRNGNGTSYLPKQVWTYNGIQSVFLYENATFKDRTGKTSATTYTSMQTRNCPWGTCAYFDGSGIVSGWNTTWTTQGSAQDIWEFNYYNITTWGNLIVWQHPSTQQMCHDGFYYDRGTGVVPNLWMCLNTGSTAKFSWPVSGTQTLNKWESYAYSATGSTFAVNWFLNTTAIAGTTGSDTVLPSGQHLGGLPAASGGLPIVGTVGVTIIGHGSLNSTQNDHFYNTLTGVTGYGTLGSQETIPMGNANESAARTAIIAGIDSVLATKTTYQDQKILTFNGVSALGNFDLFVVSGNKRWAFNYISGNDTYTNMTSLGTTLNIWENSSLTTTNITSQVQNFITSTMN